MGPSVSGLDSHYPVSEESTLDISDGRLSEKKSVRFSNGRSVIVGTGSRRLC